MLKEFQYHFNELSVSSADIEELMGFENGYVPEPFPEYIHEGLTLAPEFCEIKGGFKIFEQTKVDTENQTIQIENQIFSPAKVVTTQLKNATAAALFVCTAGAQISAHSQHLAAEGDTLLSYVFDVIGSLTVDKAVDKMEEELKQQVNTEGLHISDRYSPGYCDWSVADQQKLFALLPSEFCGISLAKSMLMSPIKSVSGIIGIGKNLRQIGYQCNWCNDTNCIYGKMKRKKNN